MMRGTVLATLTRHFVSSIVAPPILTDLGVDALRRTLSSVVAMLLVFGIFVVRALFKRYTDLGGETSPDAYVRALAADTLMMITLPMLIVGLITCVLSPTLFPDEVDYRVLTPLPIARLEIFAAKCLALVTVVLITVVAVTAISSLWFPLATGSRWAQPPWTTRVTAHGIATSLAATWAFLAVAAIQGLCVVVMPRRWERVGAPAVQALVFVLLLLAVPFVIRMPTLDVASLSDLWWWRWLPPAWFYSLEASLLGSAAARHLSGIRNGAIAFAGSGVALVGCYALLYRSAERFAGTTFAAGARGAGVDSGDGWSARLVRRWFPPQTLAVMSFALSGLARSRLHQLVCLLILGIGGAILLAQLTGTPSRTMFPAWHQRVAEHRAFAAPLLAALSTVLALRAAFLIPLDHAAAWLFRLTEDDRTRRHLLNAVLWLFAAGAVVLASIVGAIWPQPISGASPVSTGGVAKAGLSALLVMFGVEIFLREWSRIPYTCSYLPGKRVLAYTLGVLFACYAVFVYLGAHLVRWGLSSPRLTVLVAACVMAALLWLRRERLRSWGRHALEFEDEDPLAVRSLGLLPDERRY